MRVLVLARGVGLVLRVLMAGLGRGLVVGVMPGILPASDGMMGVMVLWFVVDHLVVLVSLGFQATVLGLAAFNLVAALDLVTIHHDHMTIMLNVAGLMMPTTTAAASSQGHRQHQGHSGRNSSQTNTRYTHIKSPAKRQFYRITRPITSAFCEPRDKTRKREGG